jgi:LacI family transcriptional regulator
VPNIANPFFAALAARLEHHLGAAGRRLLISSTGMSPQRQEEQLEDLLSRGIDGVIISACCTRGCQRVADAGVALVTVDRPLGPGIPHVGMDDHEAGRVLGRHLASRGCQRVGVAVVPSRQDACFAARLWGLRDGFGRRDGMAPVLNIRGVLTRQKARDCVAEHLALGGPPPDTLVGLNNVCTFGLLDALAGAGLGVAEAISVAGIDDFPAASLLRPPLTVVAQPVEAIAATAASLLEEAQARKPTRHVLLAPELVVRASVGGPERGLR